jgi:hypothetical protein
MREDWSREEVEATVADYFDMLDAELRGVEYNKTAHRRRLLESLNGRSDGAIERKHQNISAVLISLGFPYVLGYKPLRNYQQLLSDVVSNRLQDSRALADIVVGKVGQLATPPNVDDILASLVDPPNTDHLRHRIGELEVREMPLGQYNVDYFAQEARNRSLGAAGEEFVVLYEKARLIHAGERRLASMVEHVAVTRGDGAGFDVLSFDVNGRERFIEVKTTDFGSLTPFFVTRTELETSRRAASDFHLYRTFEFRRRPKLFTRQGPLDQSFVLDPHQYIAKVT